MTDQAKARAIKEIREAIANYEITKVRLAGLAGCHPDTVRRMVKGVPGSRGIRASTLQTLIKALRAHRTKMAAASRVKPGKGNGGSRHMRTRKDGELPPAVGFPVEAWEREDVQPTAAELAAELPEVKALPCPIPPSSAERKVTRDEAKANRKASGNLGKAAYWEKMFKEEKERGKENYAKGREAEQLIKASARVEKVAIRTELDAALLELEEAEQLITMGTRRAGRAKAAIVRALSKLGA